MGPVTARRAGLAALVVLCLILAAVRAGPVAAPAERAAREAAASALGVYVALRSINAVLSFAQEIEVGGSFGVSANTQPLKFLEPVDDTVERVAGAVFWVSLLAGVLSLGVAPVASLGFLLLAAGLGLASIRRQAGHDGPLRRAEAACGGLGLFLALLLPLSLVLGNGLGTALTRSDWNAAQAELDAISARADALLGATEAEAPRAPEATGRGLLDRLGDAVSSVGSSVGDVVGGTEAYLAAASYFLGEADTLFVASMKILSIFLLRTLVLPVVLIGVGLALARRLIGD